MPLRSLLLAFVILPLAGWILACHGAPSSPRTQRDGSLAARPIVLTNATIIDGTGAPAIERGWIRIEGDRIAQTGQGTAPSTANAQVIDLTGRTVVPGLGDMHVHLGPLARARWMLKLLLAHGVTTIKEAGNSLDNDEAIRDWVRGEELVPRLYLSGVTINGSADQLRFLLAGSPTRQLLEDNRAFGVDFIKIHNFVSSPALEQIAAFARKHDLYLTGHVPIGGTSVAAIDAGMTILEHLRLRPSELNDDPEVQARFPMDLPFLERENHWAFVDLRSQPAQRTIAAWEKRRERFFVDPTLVVHRTLAHADDPSTTGRADVRLASPALQRIWKSDSFKRWGVLGPEGYALAKRAAANQGKFTALVHARGIRVLTGTDTPTNWVVPGPSLHHEIELLVEAGLSPVAAIQASTGMVAQALRRKDRGTIAAGQVADLVVVNGNAAADIKAIRRIERVILAGRMLERAQLLEEARRLAAADTP